MQSEVDKMGLKGGLAGAGTGFLLGGGPIGAAVGAVIGAIVGDNLHPSSSPTPSKNSVCILCEKPMTYKCDNCGDYLCDEHVMFVSDKRGLCQKCKKIEERSRR
jgi:hypothetical protein